MQNVTIFNTGVVHEASSNNSVHVNMHGDGNSSKDSPGTGVK